MTDISDGIQLLDDEALIAVKRIRLGIITSLAWSISGSESSIEMAWAVVDACDLALQGNSDARLRVTQLVRNGARALPTCSN